MFNIKQNDTSPSLQVALSNAANRPVNLIGAVVRFHMKTEDDLVLVNKLATVVNQEGGIVRYDWEVGDTNYYGLCFAEFQVTYEDQNIETFPNSGYIKIKIAQEIA